MKISRTASVVHTAIIASLFALSIMAGIATTPSAEAANSCTPMQSSKAVSAPLTALGGAGSCVEKCTARASQLGTSISCQIQNTYVPDPPIWMCMPDGFGGEVCGNYYPSTGTTVETCSAGTGAIIAGAANQSAASCAYIAAPTVNFTSNLSTVQNGQSVTLSWTSTNAVSCNAVASGVTAGSKTQVVNAGAQTSATFTVTCLNSIGESASDSVTINVANPNTPASCTPWDTSRVGSGVQVASFSTTNASSCINTCATYSESNPGSTFTCSIVSSGYSYQTSGVITPPEPAWSDGNSSTECRVYSGASTGPSSSYTLNRLGEGYTPGAAETYRETCTNGSCTEGGQWSAGAYVYATNYGCGQTKYCWTDATYNSSSGAATCTSAPTGSPDLRASSILPATAAAGQVVTLAATIANTGGAPTAAGFTNLFQVSNAADGSGATDIGTHANALLGVNASNAATLNYTFATPGTYYVRACADKSSAANTGTITESDEVNNCSAWTAISVLTPLNLTANGLSYTGTIQEGQVLNLTGTVLNNGTVTTGVGFNNVLEYRLGNSGGFSAITTIANAALAGGANNANAGTFSIPAGTGGQVLWVQYCVDNGNVITESDETVADNCRQVNLGTISSLVSATAGVVLEASINGGGWSNADQQTVNATDSVVLRWTSSNVTSCSGTGATFSVSTLIGSTGVDTPPANSSVVFAVNCDGLLGSASDTLEIITRQLPNLTVAQNASPRFGTFDGATQSYSEVEIFFRTQNSGGADAGSAVDYKVEFDSNNDGDYNDAGESVYTTNGVGAIAAASGENDSEVIPGPISFGPHNVRITVDASGDPGKVDETDDVIDNVHQSTVTIAPVDPGLSLDSNATQVQNNGAVTLTWNVNNPYSMDCQILGPKLGTTPSFDPTDPGAQKSFTTQPLTAKSEYTLSCDAGGTTFTDTVIVETQGVIEEI